MEPKILAYLRQAFGEDAPPGATEDFGLPLAGPRAQDAESQMFFPWLLYDWSARSTAESGETAARRFLRALGDRLDEPERRFAEAVSATPFSFHEVLAAEPGRSLRLRDVLLGAEATAYERSGSRYFRDGDLTYARVVAFQDAALIVGCGSLVLPPEVKLEVLDLRALLRVAFRSVTPERLRRMEPQLRAFYFTIRQRLLEPARPEMTNTDGDPMEIHTLTYRIESAQAAFDALRALAYGHDRDDLLRDATLGPDGSIREFSFSWSKAGNAMHSTWDNTILGEISVEGTRLSADVNSAKRAKKLRAEIERRLGKGATFLGDHVRSLDGLLAEQERLARTPAGRRAAREDERFRNEPEVQELLRRTEERHWDAWVDQKIPALGGRTPRRAVRDEEGRERVEALLRGFERQERRGTAYDVNRIRARLGLPARDRGAAGPPPREP